MKKFDAYLKLHLIFLSLWVLILAIALVFMAFVDFADEKPVEEVVQIEVVAQKQVPKPEPIRTKTDTTEHITVEILPITDEEVKLMAMIVHAEAEGESFFGRTLVAKTVLNRVKHGKFFGSTISEVIFKPEQFDGIKRDCFKAGDYTSSDIDAVLAALDEQSYSDILYFCNPKTATDKKQVTATLKGLVIAEGKHIFSR